MMKGDDVNRRLKSIFIICFTLSRGPLRSFPFFVRVLTSSQKQVHSALAPLWVYFEGSDRRWPSCVFSILIDALCPARYRKLA